MLNIIRSLYKKKMNPYATAIDKGAVVAEKLLDNMEKSERRKDLVIRAPPPKESVSMVLYIVIAVVIITVLLIYFGLGRKWEQAPKYESVFNSFTPDRMVLHPERRPAREMVSDSSRVFGVMPRRPIKLDT